MPELLEVTLEQRYFDQTCINRWNYIASGTPAAVAYSYGMAYAFGAVVLNSNTTQPFTDVLQGIRNIQVSAVQNIQLTVLNVYDLDDFYSVPFGSGVDGLGGIGEGLSPTSALGFRSTQTTRNVRRGYKRFVGAYENDVGAGGVINAELLTAMDALATIMAESLTFDDEGNTLTFQPCIVKKERYDTPAGTTAYRYYKDDPVTQLANTATGIAWQAYPQVRTQTSRQYGRGI